MDLGDIDTQQKIEELEVDQYRAVVTASARDADNSKELLDRVNAVGVHLEAIDGTEDKDVVVPRRDGSITLKGEFYLKHFVLPNFFFHVTTAYALLRGNGIDVGKKDFLG